MNWMQVCVRRIDKAMSEKKLDRNISPAVSVPRHWEVQEPVRTVMPNGIPVYAFPADESEVVRMDILFGGGRWQQEQPLQALFANRMLREGTRRFSSEQIAERLDYYGAWLELSCASEYTHLALYSLGKYLPQTLALLESMVTEPLFPQKELDVVLDNNIRQFLINSSKADFLANRALMKALFGDRHPVGHWACEEDYRRISPEVLQSFYRQFYHSGNCAIYLAGQVDEHCLQLVEEHFGQKAFGAASACPVPSCLHRAETAGESSLFIERKGAAQSVVRMGCLSINQHHPDYLKLRVLVTLFGGYFGSRLMTNIREEKGYTYGISAGLLPYPENGLLTIAADTAGQNVQALVQEVFREMDRLQEEPVSADELERVRRYMLGEMCRSYESVFSLSDAWIFVHVSGLQKSYFADIFQAIRRITPDEVRDLARKYLCKEKLKVVVCGEKIP